MFLVVAVNVDILLVCADVDPIPDKQRCQQNISQFSQNLPSKSSVMGVLRIFAYETDTDKGPKVDRQFLNVYNF